ncbi:hypothetical protein JXO52_01525 [bacterium]|nr:hypothetical protein [bacterium]
MSNRSTLILGILLIFVTAMTASAQHSTDNLSIHGFVSKGFLQSTGNNYMTECSKDGSFEWGEAAISFMATPSSKLRIGAQLYARDIGFDSNFLVTLDWAYGDYHWKDFLGFRVGRMKNPMGLYSAIRDIDMARVPALLPQSTYNEQERDFTLAVDGLGIYGILPVSKLGDFEYDLVYGAYNIFDQNSSYFQNEYYGVGSQIAAGMAASPGIVSVTWNSTLDNAAEIERVITAKLAWNTPLTGLKIGSCYNKVKFAWDFKSSFDIEVLTGDPTMPSIAMTQTIPINGEYDIQATGYFGEWQFNRLTLSGEYRTFTIEGDTYVGADPATHSKDTRTLYYGMANYQLNRWLNLSAYYSSSDTNNEEKELLQGYPEHHAWQNDICFTGRIDVTSNWIMKLEYHSIDGTGQTFALFNPEGLTQKWNMFIAKTTFHF